MLQPRYHLISFYLFEFEQNVRNTACLYIHNIRSGDKTKGDFSLFHLFKNVGMRKIVKQVIGVDVSQKELVVCFGRMYDDWTPELYLRKTFPNSLKGFERLLLLVDKQTESKAELRFVMEATGVYHETLAYHLSDLDREVCIVLPNKISNYMRTLDTRTVTDNTAAEAIAMFGLERKLEKWER